MEKRDLDVDGGAEEAGAKFATPSVAVYTCNPSTQETEAGGQ